MCESVCLLAVVFRGFDLGFLSAALLITHVSGCKNFKMKLNNTPMAICKYILLKDLLMRQPRDQMFSSFFSAKAGRLQL